MADLKIMLPRFWWRFEDGDGESVNLCALLTTLRTTCMRLVSNNMFVEVS